MPPNTNSITTSTENLNQAANNNNCGLNQHVEATFAHHLHQQQLHSANSQIVSQAQYQSTIALPTALNANPTFYTPHFAMQQLQTSQFSPITSSTPIVAVSTALGHPNHIGSINSPVSLYAASKAPLSSINSFCTNGNDDNSTTVAFMEPQSVLLSVGCNEDTSANSSGSGSLAGSNCSAVSSCSADNGGTSSNGSISSLTSASQYEYQHANSAYSKYRQNEIKPESNGYNEKYSLHPFRYEN